MNGPEQFVPPTPAPVGTLGPFLRVLVLGALAIAFASPAVAQRGGGSAGHGVSLVRSGIPPFAGGRGRSFASVRGARGFGPRYDRYAAPYYSLPFPFFDDAVDSGDIYSTGYPVAAPLPPFLPTRGSRSYSNDYADAEPSTQPLMIELQNGRYVRVNNAAIDGEAQPINSASNDVGTTGSASRSQGPAIATPAANDMAPVVLIFRDGHTEQVRDYTIADGTLYARGDFYTDGYWNKNIDLSRLNIAETLQANSEQGVKFVLPSSPNEVITRP